MSRTQYPVSLELIGDGSDFRVRASVSLERALADNAHLGALLDCIETDYIITLSAAKFALNCARRTRRRNRHAWWCAGRLISDFLSRLASRDLYLLRQTATLAAHLGVSVGTLYRILAFYRRYADPFSIEPPVTRSTGRRSGEPRRRRGST